MNKYQQGQIAEQLVAKHYESKNYKIIAQNYNIRGGEIDIIVENKKSRIFIEVKLVNNTKYLHDYITPRKLITLQKTIRHYLFHNPTDKTIRLDVAFVRGNTIFYIYENVTNN